MNCINLNTQSRRTVGNKCDYMPSDHPYMSKAPLPMIPTPKLEEWPTIILLFYKSIGPSWDTWQPWQPCKAQHTNFPTGSLIRQPMWLMTLSECIMRNTQKRQKARIWITKVSLLFYNSNFHSSTTVSFKSSFVRGGCSMCITYTTSLSFIQANLWSSKLHAYVWGCNDVACGILHLQQV